MSKVKNLISKEEIIFCSCGFSDLQSNMIKIDSDNFLCEGCCSDWESEYEERRRIEDTP